MVASPPTKIGVVGPYFKNTTIKTTKWPSGSDVPSRTLHSASSYLMDGANSLCFRYSPFVLNFMPPRYTPLTFLATGFVNWDMNLEQCN